MEASEFERKCSKEKRKKKEICPAFLTSLQYCQAHAFLSSMMLFADAPCCDLCVCICDSYHRVRQWPFIRFNIQMEQFPLRVSYLYVRNHGVVCTVGVSILNQPSAKLGHCRHCRRFEAILLNNVGNREHEVRPSKFDAAFKA